MPTTPVMLQPRRLTDRNPLAADAVAHAQAFELGGQTVALKTATGNLTGAVAQFDLRPAAVRKLGRKENLTQCVVAAIETSSVPDVDRYLSKISMPKQYRADTTFFIAAAKRRKPSRTRADLLLTGAPTIVQEESFLLGVGEDDKQRVYFLIIPQRRRGAVLFYPGFLGKLDVDDGDSVESPDPDATHYPEETDSEDFARCYKDCFDNLPPWLLATVGGICTGCVAAIGATIASTGITATALAITCGACVAAVGLVMGNCLLTCHEML